MSCRWLKAPDGRWLVVVPEHEVLLERGGAGTYHVERRDGTSQDVVVVRVSPPKMLRGERVCYGVPEDTARDRAARVAPLSHAPPSPFVPRLTKQGSHVVAPASEVDEVMDIRDRYDGNSDVRVWLDGDRGRWDSWTHEGVRMVRVPVEATRAL